MSSHLARVNSYPSLLILSYSANFRPSDGTQHLLTQVGQHFHLEVGLQNVSAKDPKEYESASSDDRPTCQQPARPSRRIRPRRQHLAAWPLDGLLTPSSEVTCRRDVMGNHLPTELFPVFSLLVPPLLCRSFPSSPPSSSKGVSLLSRSSLDLRPPSPPSVRCETESETAAGVERGTARAVP